MDDEVFDVDISQFESSRPFHMSWGLIDFKKTHHTIHMRVHDNLYG